MSWDRPEPVKKFLDKIEKFIHTEVDVPETYQITRYVYVVCDEIVSAF